MKLKFVIATAAEVPAHLKESYIEREGKFYLDVEGAVDAARLAEFRQANTDLKGQVETLTAKVTGKDVAEVRGIKFEDAVLEVDAALQKAKDDAVKAGKGDLDKTLAERTQAMRDEHAKTVTKLSTEKTTMEKELSKLKIDAEVLKFGNEHGLRPEAAQDLLYRAGATFKVVDGKVVAFDSDGKERYGPTSEPLTIKDWIPLQAKDAPHLFQASTGAGTPGGKGNPGAQTSTGANPWDPKTLNITQQSQLYRNDKPTAIRLAAMHGVNLPG